MSTEVAKQENQTLEKVRDLPMVSPRYRVRNLDHAYRIDVQMPGVNRESARITIEGDQLVIEGERSQHFADSWQAVHREIAVANYRLVLDLNVQIDADKVSARSENGVLQVTLPVAEAARPRMIEVN
ncbi:MAG: Hsp20/alpha crystallin family protein [Opitutales bacterium]|nr:Hsp20/alpha crystallin family protein [Opitutales bacterium]